MLKAAPTGTAGFLIGGDTLHATFHIDVGKNSVKKDVKPKSEMQLREIQNKWKDVQLVLIDEKSMMSLYTLYTIDQRLRQFKPKSAKLPFGGVSLIIMGDFAQLPPVQGQPLYSTKTKEFSVFQQFGKELFENCFKKSIIFDRLMRQKDDDQEHFREKLNRLKNGKTTQEDWMHFRTRELTSNGEISDEEKKEIWENGIMICAYNKDLIRYNLERIRKLDMPIAKIISENTPKSGINLTAQQAHGLPPELWIAKGALVKATTNLEKPFGITNGAKGYVRDIIYPENTKPPELPRMVIVYFPEYIGKLSYLGMEGCYPVVPIERRWGKNKSRKMVPLRLGYASTIHSCQGLSIKEKVIINLGTKEFTPNLTYTALTRVSRFEQLSFWPKIPEFHPRFTGIKKTKLFEMRMEHTKKEEESNEKFNSEDEFESENEVESEDEVELEYEMEYE